MWKLILLALAVYGLYRLLSNDFLRKKKEEDYLSETRRSARVEAGEMVADPVCGTFVEVESSISVRDKSGIHYFCSYECRDSYLRSLKTAQDEK